ncbi:MAG: galactokinase [Gemmatimonadota bacterium]|nr:MAG: galactokinase [Gemmatimonadota bacterium]
MTRPDTQLQAAFAEQFGGSSFTHMVRAPGRVNLMGDHTDYNGLPVVPMAIQRGLTLVSRLRKDGEICIANTDPRFPPRSFELTGDIDPFPGGDWGNYAKAAGQALAQRYGPLAGFDAVVSSDIPIAAGLSSSSALVMAVALMIVDLNDVAIGAAQLMELIAEAERYVGTRGGGMDQAICLGAQPGSASRIDFNPLRLTPIPIPNGWRFIVAFSGIRAEKSGATRRVYNQRTRECEEALRRVATALGLGEAVSYPGLMSGMPVADLLAAAEGVLEESLFPRFRHVVTEATRVTSAEVALKADDIAGFGKLMNLSHQSLRDDFAVSCAALDQLTAVALGAGVAGARLTGAGFGGCVVALSPATEVERVLHRLEREYYIAAGCEGELGDSLFVAQPSGGASVVEL